MDKINKDNLKMPIMFQKIKEFETEDTRFTKVKIWVCHDGRNHHDSDISKQVIEDAIPTLANTPILGYIENNKDNDIDYSDHRKELVRGKGLRPKYRYVGRAYGLIPENNNAQFEYRLCDDGIERLYLTCEGLLWNKWDDPIDIMNIDIVKSQSMELHDDSDGYVDEDNVFVFTKINFFGCCILGKDHKPAMESSTIELVYSKQIQDEMELFKEEINGKMEEFNKHFSIGEERSVVESMSKQVEETVVDEEVKVILEDSEFAKSDEDKKKKEEEEAKAKKSKEADKSDEDKEPKEEKEKEESEDDKKKKADKSKKKFEDAEELSAEELADSIVAEKDGKVADLVDKASKDEFADDSSEVAKLKKEIESLKEQITKLKGDVNEYEKVERQKSETELFAKYAELDGIEDYEALKDKASEFACLNDLEKDIALVFVKNKANLSFTKQVETKEETFESTKINFDNKSEDDGYGGLLNKYLNK